MTDQERYPDPSEIRHVIGAEGSFSLQSISGTVELRSGGTDEAIVIVRSESGHGDPLPIVVRRTEGGLHIEVEKQGTWGFGVGSLLRGRDAGLEFEITLPRHARIDINTVSADIQARFLGGEQSYRTVSGDIEIDPDGGRLSVTSVSGDIELRAAEPIELSANSTSGDINVQGAVLNHFDARTVSGDVEFEAGLAAGPLHSVQTVSGDLSVGSTTGVTVEVKRSMDFARGGSTQFVAGDGSAHLRFRTLSGDCHVENARRTDRDEHRGRGHRRWERQLERHGERIAREFMASRDFLPTPPVPPVPPRPPMSPRPEPPRPQADQLEVLRALERGEIDVEEAQRRLQEA
jgi:hypothetical protein